MSKRWQLALGISFFALMFFYLGVRAYVGLILPGTVGRRGWYAELRDGKQIITFVSEETPAAGVLQVGDEIIALKSVRADRMPVVTQEFWRVPPGTPYMLIIRRAEQSQEVPLQTAVVQQSDQGRTSFVILLITLALFLLTGLTVFVLKRGDQQAWLLALLLGSITALIPLNVIFATLSRWMGYSVSLISPIATIFLPVFLHFFLIFPARSPLLRGFPHLLRLIYLSYLVVLLPLFTVQLLIDNGYTPAWRNVLGDWPDLVFTALALAYLAAGLMAMLINYRAADAGARRKLRVVMAGSGIGFFNLFLMPLGDALDLNRSFPQLWRGLNLSFLFTLPLIPLSFAYAIIKHQVIPVSLIIRRGARYLLVARGSIVLVIAIVAVLTFFVMDAIFNRLRTEDGRIIGGFSALVAILVWQLARGFHRRIVAPQIDRMFFHQAYDAQQIIAELGAALRTATSLPRLLEMVATRIQSALQTTTVAILLRDETSGAYPCAYACEYSFHNRQAFRYPCKISLPPDAAVITRLAASDQPIDLDGHDPQSSSPFANVSAAYSSNEERETLRQLKPALLLPIMGKDGLLGVISLGPHLGDLPFSSDDKKLLLSVGGPISFALENARLIERMIADARQRQELEAENEQRAKELEEARRLQLSMLPKSVPQLPHLDIAAYMKTATEVGGDYYDFHLTDDGTLTVAVGDATGHGLKAGTVVTAMKSLFYCYAGEPELLPVLNQSSRVLKRMNLRSMFMGLTVIKLRGGQLKISAAGMPPTFIYRAQTGAVDEVLIKALPLGSLANYTYREQEMALDRGDVLVLMSDGLPERFNPDGEMFDYARVKTALTAAAADSAQAIIERLVSAGESWAQGRPQDDDVTFVVLKVK